LLSADRGRSARSISAPACSTGHCCCDPDGDLAVPYLILAAMRIPWTSFDVQMSRQFEPKTSMLHGDYGGTLSLAMALEESAEPSTIEAARSWLRDSSAMASDSVR